MAANIIYRASSTPSIPGSTSVKGSGLTNLEIDGNWYSITQDIAGYKDQTITFTGKTISGSTNTFSNIPTTALTGTLGVGNGGTGQTSVQAAINALLASVATGTYARGNGTNVVMSAIQATDVPTLNQNTTGTSANVTGIVAVANGGTGGANAAAALKSLYNNSITVISTNTTAVSGNSYVLTANLTLTLPAAAVSGDIVEIINRSGVTTCVVARNGLTIMSLAEDMTLDSYDNTVILTYADATRGWCI